MEVRNIEVIKYWTFLSHLNEFLCSKFQLHAPFKESIRGLFGNLIILDQIFEETDLPQISVQTRDVPAYPHKSEARSKPWFHDIMTSLKYSSYPNLANSTDKRTFIKLAFHFLHSETLYRRSYDSVLLGCVDAS